MTDQPNPPAMTDEQKRAYAAELLDEHGTSCEYLTVVECAPEVLGHDISEADAQAVHDLIRAGGGDEDEPDDDHQDGCDLGHDPAQISCQDAAVHTQALARPTPLADFVQHFRTGLLYAAPETWADRIYPFLDELVARYNPLIEGTVEQAEPGEPPRCPRPRPDNAQLVELRRQHPTPWRVDEDYDGQLVDALNQEVTTSGIEQLVADAVNALVGAAHEEG